MFFDVFLFFSRDFRGSVAIKNPCFFGGFSLLFPKKNKERKDREGGSAAVCDPNPPRPFARHRNLCGRILRLDLRLRVDSEGAAMVIWALWRMELPRVPIPFASNHGSTLVCDMVGHPATLSFHTL